jgi:hypothetical protein
MKKVVFFYQNHKRYCLLIILTLLCALVLNFFHQKSINENKVSELSSNLNKVSFIFIYNIMLVTCSISIKQKYIILQGMDIKYRNLFWRFIISVSIFYTIIIIGLSLTCFTLFPLEQLFGIIYLQKHFIIALIIYLLSSLPFLVALYLYNYLYDQILLTNQIKLINNSKIRVVIYKHNIMLPITGSISTTLYLVLQVFLDNSIIRIILILVCSSLFLYICILSTDNYINLVVKYKAQPDNHLTTAST